MATYKFGFIGTGNMGSALARAVSKTVSGDEILLTDASSKKAQLLAEELDCSYTETEKVALMAKYIFLGVKPQMMEDLLKTIAPILKSRKDRFVLISMAAGLKISKLEEMLGEKYPIIRIMPNTPVSQGKGMIVYTISEAVFMDEAAEFCDALKKGGRIDRIDENLIDAASAISGCGPAFVYLFAEAMADAGVECGLSRAKSLEYTAQTLSGAAELLLNTGKHPGQLKDEVCSPAGSTIEGVHTLENSSFRGTVMNAVKNSFKRTKELGK
ncbi:MAG: pyrroline-5-carboxylate reductase [Ruminococcaceae bacterium]|nr:pyrroline-5-carboxylate reductase [Oscillospiraceae bacterium]